MADIGQEDITKLPEILCISPVVIGAAIKASPVLYRTVSVSKQVLRG